MRVLRDFLGLPHSPDKTTLIIKVMKKATILNRYDRIPHMTLETRKESDKNTRQYHAEKSQQVTTRLQGTDNIA